MKHSPYPSYFSVQQSGAVEACWAHNPEVRRSKLRSAKLLFSAYDKVTIFPGHKTSAPGEDRTHDLQISLWSIGIMRLTRCLLRYRGS